LFFDFIGKQQNIDGCSLTGFDFSFSSWTGVVLVGGGVEICISSSFFSSWGVPSSHS